MTTDRVTETLDYLELVLASDFSEQVTAKLRSLSDNEINTLYLMTHTGPNMGDPVHRWQAVLLPLIEHEADIRRFVDECPRLGPAAMPERFPKGKGRAVA